MNPFWLFTRIAGMAFLTAAGVALLVKKLGPKPDDLVTGAIHFRKSFEEFQKGVTSVFFGSREPSPEETAEGTRIPTHSDRVSPTPAAMTSFEGSPSHRRPPMSHEILLAVRRAPLR